MSRRQLAFGCVVALLLLGVSTDHAWAQKDKTYVFSSGMFQVPTGSNGYVTVAVINSSDPIRVGPPVSSEAVTYQVNFFRYTYDEDTAEWYRGTSSTGKSTYLDGNGMKLFEFGPATLGEWCEVIFMTPSLKVLPVVIVQDSSGRSMPSAQITAANWVRLQ